MFHSIQFYPPQGANADFKETIQLSDLANHQLNKYSYSNMEFCGGYSTSKWGKKRTHPSDKTLLPTRHIMINRFPPCKKLQKNDTETIYVTLLLQLTSHCIPAYTHQCHRHGTNKLYNSKSITDLTFIILYNIFRETIYFLLLLFFFHSVNKMYNFNVKGPHSNAKKVC